MKTLLMLGDSLVEWGDWDVLLPGYSVINRGVAGEDVEGLSARLHDELEDAGQPDYILLMAGTNNLLMGNPYFPAIYSTMLPRLRLTRPESTVIVNSILPMQIAPGREVIDRVNRELEQAAASSGCCFLDMDEAWNLHCLPLTKPGFMEDGVHLTTRGYQVWAREIANLLQGLDSSRRD